MPLDSGINEYLVKGKNVQFLWHVSCYRSDNAVLARGRYGAGEVRCGEAALTPPR